MSESLIPTDGDYRKLKSFQVAELVYDVTDRNRTGLSRGGLPLLGTSLLAICALLAATLTTMTGCGGGISGRPAPFSRQSGLPAFLRYAGAQALGDMDWDVDGVGTSLNILKTTDSVPAVIAHYESLLTGWKDCPVSARAGTSIGCTSPDGKQTVVITAKRGSDGGTTFSIFRIFSDTVQGEP